LQKVMVFVTRGGGVWMQPILVVQVVPCFRAM